jgi:rod shape-determining protein MreD
MANLVGLPLLAIFAILQSTLIVHLRLLDGRPDLVLLLVVSWSLVGRAEEAMLWGAFGGMLLDLLSGFPLGSTALILVLIAFLVSLAEGRLWEINIVLPLGVMLGASLLYYYLGLLILPLLGREIDLLVATGRVILPSAFLNMLLALPSFQLAQGLRNRLYPPEVEI